MSKVTEHVTGFWYPVVRDLRDYDALPDGWKNGDYARFNIHRAFILDQFEASAERMGKQLGHRVTVAVVRATPQYMRKLLADRPLTVDSANKLARTLSAMPGFDPAQEYN